MLVIKIAPLLTLAGVVAGCGGALDELLGNDAFARDAAAMYAEQPDIGQCKSGTLLDIEKSKALNTLNDVRRVHGLGPVGYDIGSDREVMQASLMMAANGELDHNPPPSWRCYTPEGAAGAGSSNLSGGRGRYLQLGSTEDNIIGWYTDVANAVPNNVGHRRWILDPFLQSIAYGRVATSLGGSTSTDGSALKLIEAKSPSIAALAADFVAYPSGEFPRKYFEARALFSFSAVVDKGNKYANSKVDFSKATVSVLSDTGRQLGVKNVSFDNVGYGLPNNLQFNVDGVDVGARYSVRIQGVGTPGGIRNFEYAFRIVP